MALLKFGKIDDQPKICQLFIILFLHIYLQPVNTSFVLLHSLALVAVVSVNTQGSVSPPCGKMDEYCQCPVTLHAILLPLLINIKQIADVFLDTYLTTCRYHQSPRSPRPVDRHVKFPLFIHKVTW